MKGRVVERFRGRGKISCNIYFQQRNQIYYETVGLQIFWKTKNKQKILSKGGFPLFCNSSYWLRLFIKFFILGIFLIFHTDLHFEVSLYFLYTFCHDHKAPFFCYSVDYRSQWMNYLRKLKICNNSISKCTIGLKYIGINTPLWSPRKGLFQDADSTFVVGLKTLYFF